MITTELIAQEPMLRFFRFEHLPPSLQSTSKPLAEHAVHAVETLPRCAERTAGLRKLLEAKDCFVRAAIEE